MRFFLIACAFLAAQHDVPIDEPQFFRLIDGLHRDIGDVSLICEGAAEFVGPRDILPKDANIDKKYQCIYHYRRDGAARIESYSRGEGVDALFIHRIDALLGSRREELELVPDTKRIGKAKVTRGSNGSLRMPGSPHNIIFLWYFQWLAGTDQRNFKYQGWEAIDGHECLRVQFDFVPGLQLKSQAQIRFWIDLSRGGHPLRIEMLWGNEVAWRVDRIALDHFPLPGGGRAWLPVDGIVEHFRWGLKTSLGTPVFRESYHVVKDTVRLNRNLPDTAFEVKWKDTVPSASGLARMRREFDEEAIHSSVPRPPRDPDSVKKRLDQQIVEADRQATMLEAASVARSGWEWPAGLWFALVGVGGALLGASAIWRWRRP